MPEKYGLIGEKLGHSFSKLIHNRLGDYDYQLYSIPRDEIDGFLKKRDFAGLNVTIPYKQTVIPYCDILTDAAKKIGSVNTLSVLPDGRLLGDNTDYAGFLNLADNVGIDFAGKNVVILGSGGTSLTARTAAADRGAKSVTIVSRSGEVNYHNIYELCDTEIIINTTPVGMYPKNGEKKVELIRFPKLCGVLDVVYNPLATALLLEAKRLGIPCGCGLRMLVAQAKFAAERFTGSAIDNSRIDEIELWLRKKLTNIALVGMPGCGKTTFAKLLGEKLGREVVETDSLIEENAGITIPEIFANQGETAFRDIESRMVMEAGSRTGIIISTGGGAVKRRENVDALRQNAVVVWLRRPLELLATDGRPLSKGLDALKAMWEERREIYESAADFAVDNDESMEKTMKLILEGFDEAVGDKRA